jgi:DNA-binding LacI/PurR family transcriptional regulator
MAVKLKDIAQATGVSISTVSRILNGDPANRKSSDETCRKVLDTAREMGYMAEYQAKMEVLQSEPEYGVYSIGCILTSDHESFVSPFFSTLLAGIQNELAKEVAHGGSFGHLRYRFYVMNIKDHSFPRFIATTRLDCGIMLGTTSLENIMMLREKIPNLVYAGVNSIGNGFDEVICDGRAGAVAAVQYLAQLGHRKIGFIGPTLQKVQVYNEHRYQGYLEGMAAAGLETDERFVAESYLTSADGYDRMLQLINSGRLPTAIFCANDTVALGVMKALNEKGISIPGDISVMGFDDIEMASYITPTLTTVSVPTKELGRLAVKVMLDRMETRRSYAIRLNVPFSLALRESCQGPAHG